MDTATDHSDLGCLVFTYSGPEQDIPGNVWNVLDAERIQLAN